MSKKLTHEEFIRKLATKNSKHNKIIFLEAYQGALTRIRCQCSECGYGTNGEWNPTPASLLTNNGCPSCAGNLRKTHDVFLKEFQQNNKNFNDIILKSTYINSETSLKCECKKCGYGKNGEWNIRPYHLLHGSGCPSCAGVLKKTWEEILDTIKHNNIFYNDIIFLGDYIDRYTHVSCVCKKCGYLWRTSPLNLMGNHGCPNCNSFHSKGEMAIADWLNEHNISYIKEYPIKIEGKILRFDFWLEKYNLAIEYDGKHHFEPVDFGSRGIEVAKQRFDETIKNDTLKNDYCRNNDLKIIRIPYWDLKQIPHILGSVFNTTIAC